MKTYSFGADIEVPVVQRTNNGYQSTRIEKGAVYQATLEKIIGVEEDKIVADIETPGREVWYYFKVMVPMGGGRTANCWLIYDGKSRFSPVSIRGGHKYISETWMSKLNPLVFTVSDKALFDHIISKIDTI